MMTMRVNRALQMGLPAMQKLFTRRYCVPNSVRETRIITQNDVDRFAEVSGDHNPIHKASHRPIEQRCVHGALLNALVSGIIGTKMPGPGCMVLSQQFSFPAKCVVDKEIELLVKLIENRKIMKVSYSIVQCDNVVFEGTAKLIKVTK